MLLLRSLRDGCALGVSAGPAHAPEGGGPVAQGLLARGDLRRDDSAPLQVLLFQLVLLVQQELKRKRTRPRPSETEQVRSPFCHFPAAKMSSGRPGSGRGSACSLSVAGTSQPPCSQSASLLTGARTTGLTTIGGR